MKKKTNKNISIDGKAIKNATDKINNGNIPYIVSAFIGDIVLSIGQVKVNDKSNEITAIPNLLDLLDIKNSTITIDAIGTQEEIVNKIIEKGGHYVLPVKDNQRELRKQIKSQFESYNNLFGNDNIIHTKTLETNHGRTEEREYFLCYDISCIKNKEKWKAVNAIAYTKVSRTDQEETMITENYYIEDHSRNRVENSIANLSTLRKIVFNLASLDNAYGKVPLQRKLTRYMLVFENIEKLIFEVIPNIS